MSQLYVPRTTADLTPDPPPPHLITNVCRVNGSVLLYGKTGIGKTRLLWQLACAWGHGHSIFDLTPLHPLTITIVEADMFRADFEAMIKELSQLGITAPPTLHWFSRDDTTPFFIDGTFGKTLLTHNVEHDTDLTIYDAIPDLHLGDPNDPRTAYATLRALDAATNGRAYLGVMVQRKGAKTDAHETTETVDELLGSQAWARTASTVWQMTNIPSLIWVKHRLCPKPAPLTLQMTPQGTFSLKAAGAQGLLLQEAQKGFQSVRELVVRVQARPEYARLAHPYKERMLRDLAAALVQSGRITPTSTPASALPRPPTPETHTVQDDTSRNAP